MPCRVYLGLVLPSLSLLPSHYVGSTDLPLAGPMMFCLTQCQHPETETFTLHHFPQVAATALHLTNTLCLWANRSPRTKLVPITHVQHQTPWGISHLSWKKWSRWGACLGCI